MANQKKSQANAGLGKALAGLIFIAWAVLAVLAIAGPLGTDNWAMYLGIVLGVLGVPLAIVAAKQLADS